MLLLPESDIKVTLSYWMLSQKYLQSEWCMLEFRAAHERVLNDRSNYLILVLYDDVDQNLLEDDMKLYIRTNTYLSVSNKWFWEKLHYAMPKEPLCTLRDGVHFDFPLLTAPPKSYPDYLMGYIAQSKLMAERSGLPLENGELKIENLPDASSESQQDKDTAQVTVM